jgi:hypothetical protein
VCCLVSWGLEREVPRELVLGDLGDVFRVEEPPRRADEVEDSAEADGVAVRGVRGDRPGDAKVVGRLLARRRLEWGALAQEGGERGGQRDALAQEDGWEASQEDFGGFVVFERGAGGGGEDLGGEGPRVEAAGEAGPGGGAQLEEVLDNCR